MFLVIITKSIIKPTIPLCSTNIYQGKKATCFMAIKDDIKNAGAEYVDAECVVDGNLITSRKPDDLPAFCTAILSALSK